MHHLIRHPAVVPAAGHVHAHEPDRHPRRQDAVSGQVGDHQSDKGDASTRLTDDEFHTNAPYLETSADDQSYMRMRLLTVKNHANEAHDLLNPKPVAQEAPGRPRCSRGCHEEGGFTGRVHRDDRVCELNLQVKSSQVYYQ